MLPGRQGRTCTNKPAAWFSFQAIGFLHDMTRGQSFVQTGSLPRLAINDWR